MEKHQTVLRTGFLSGTTPRVRAVIVNEDGDGFKPDELTLSIYDVSVPTTIVCPIWDSRLLTNPAVTQTIVNGRDAVDVLADCDVDGNLEHVLSVDDLAVTVPSGLVPSRIFRRLLFTWAWDTDKVGKHEIILPIVPDRSTVAT